MSRYIDGSRVVYWDDTNGNLTVPATLTATSIIGASFTLGPNVTFSSVTASTINVGSLTTPTVSTLRLNASSITGNTVSSITTRTGVLTATQGTVSSLVGNALVTSTLQAINEITSYITATSSLVAPVQFYAQELYTKDAYDYTSFGTSFVQTASSLAWDGIAVSASGQYQTAVVNAPGFIYSSSDFGTTWTQVATSQGWAHVAVSATGQIQVAAIGKGRLSYTGQIYRSTDYGATWAVLSGSPTKYWADLAVSASAQYMTATEQNPTGYIWSSSNYGVTWVQSSSAPLAAWGGVSMSASAQFQTAVVIGGTIYRSSDYGQTWVSTGVTNDAFVSVAVSASGQYQTCASQPGGGQGRLYVSSDYGATWVNTFGPSAINFINLAMSASGRFQIAHTLTTVYSSSTYGTSWTLTATVGSFLYDVAMSASGNYSVLVDSNPGFIWVSTVPLILPNTSSLTAQVGVFRGSQATVSSLVGNNVSSLTAQTGVFTGSQATVSSLVGINLSSLSAQTGVFTGTQATVSSLVSNNVSSLSSQTGVFTGSQATVSSLVGNNLSSLTAQTGVFTGSQATVSSLVGTNLSSLSAQMGVFTGSQATVSSLVGTNLSSLSAQTGVFTGTQATVSSLVTNNVSSLTAQTGLFTAMQVTASSLLSLTLSTGSAIAKTLTVSSIAGFSPISFVNDVIFTSTVSALAPMSTVSIATSSISANGIVAGAISSLSLNVGSLTALSFIPPPFTSVSTFTVNTSSFVGNNVSSLSAQSGVFTASKATLSSLALSTLVSNQLNVLVNTLNIPTQSAVIGNLYDPASASTNTLLTVGNLNNPTVYNTNVVSLINNFAQTFQQTDSYSNRAGTALSATGQFQLVAKQAGTLSLSSDYGITWASVGASRNWLSVAMSASGNYMYATDATGGTGNLYVSTDYGLTWSVASASLPTGGWAGVGISQTGQYVIAGGPTSFWLSSNYGATWSASQTTYNGGGAAISATGQYMMLGTQTIAGGSTLYTSSNYGASFTAQSNGASYNVAISGTGQYQLSVATVYSTNRTGLWLSSNYGATFTLIQDIVPPSGKYFIDVAMDYTGQYQLAVQLDYRLWYSTNYGVTWSLSSYTPSAGYWRSCGISANAQYVAASGWYIYTWSNPTALNVYGNANITQTLAVSSLVANNLSSMTTQTGTITSGSIYFNVSTPTIARAPTASSFYIMTALTNASYGSTLSMNYSYDLTNWTPVPFSFFGNVSFGYGANRIKYLNGAYFAVGWNRNVDGNSPILRSTDGINWSVPTSVPTEAGLAVNMIDILYANSLYIAVGNSGYYGWVWRSTDGQTWTDSTTASITWGGLSGGPFFYPSPGSGVGIQGIAYGNGVWVIVGGNFINSANYAGVYTSSDGITFTYNSNNPFTGVGALGTSIAFDGTKFVRIGIDSSIKWRTSTDGTTWSSGTFTGDLTWTGQNTDILYNGTMWLASGLSDFKYSYNGLAWTNVPSGGLVPGQYIYLSWNGVRWFVGISGTVSFAYSYDGFQWTSVSVPSINASVGGNYGSHVYAIESTTNQDLTLNIRGNTNISQTLTANAINAPLYGYSLLVDGSQLNARASDSGRTFLLDIANSQSSIVWLPSTSLVTRGWNCKITNMNASGSTSNGSIYVSSPQAALYAHGNQGRSTMSFVNITGGVGTNYNYYGNFVFDGLSYYALH